MDCVDFLVNWFKVISDEIFVYFNGFGVMLMVVILIFVCDGDGVVGYIDWIGWYKGLMVVEVLDWFGLVWLLEVLVLCFLVQVIYKFDDCCIVVGCIEFGSFSVGDEIVIMLVGKVVKIKMVESWLVMLIVGCQGVGCLVGIMFDCELFIECGDIVVYVGIVLCEIWWLCVCIFWLYDKLFVKGD